MSEQQRFNINLQTLKDYVCGCGSPHFIPCEHLKVLPAYAAGNDKPVLIGTPARVCAGCGKPVDPDNLDEGPDPVLLIPSKG